MISVFQIRAARSGVGITLKELTKLTGINYSILSTIEKGAPQNQIIVEESILIKLLDFYIKCGIKFLDNHNIKFVPPK